MPQPARPTRGGADSIKFMGGSGRAASMTVLDVDSEDPNLKPDAWFAYVMPTQTGVEMVGAGRFGYWDEKPKIFAEAEFIIVGDIDGEKNPDDPVLIVTTMNSITVHVAQAKHLQATPLPKLTEGQQPS